MSLFVDDRGDPWLALCQAEIMLVLCWGAVAGLAALDWWAVVIGAKRIEVWVKPATLVALILAAFVAGGPPSAAGWWLLVGLSFGLAGDVFLLADTQLRFVAGLGSFMAGHLAYLVCFLVLGLSQPRLGVVGLAVVLVALVATRRVWSTARRDGWRLVAAISSYLAVIGAMAIAAWMTGQWLIAVGATLFVVSDAMLAIDRFVRRQSFVVIMVTYHLAQVLIVLGVLGVRL